MSTACRGSSVTPWNSACTSGSLQKPGSLCRSPSRPATIPRRDGEQDVQPVRRIPEPGERQAHLAGDEGNTRQGYLNGSHPPFGYRAVETEKMAARATGRGASLSTPPRRPSCAGFTNSTCARTKASKRGKGIAFHLNERGTTLRGSRWTRGRVHEVLSNRTYMGEYVFNKRASKQGTVKPQSEWVTVKIDPIIDAETFDKVRERRESRAPSPLHPGSFNPRPC